MPAVHRKRGPMHEINIVPYVDVMLVLLVIFMVTAGVTSGAVTMKITSSTSITSTYGTMLISCIGPRLRCSAGIAYLTAWRCRMLENSSMKLSKRVARRSMSCE